MKQKNLHAHASLLGSWHAQVKHSGKELSLVTFKLLIQVLRKLKEETKKEKEALKIQLLSRHSGQDPINTDVGPVIHLPTSIMESRLRDKYNFTHNN